MEKFNRAERRAQIQRLKVKRKRYWGVSFDKSPRQLGMLVHTAAICSCLMCCSPRRGWSKEITIQERRMFQDLDE